GAALPADHQIRSGAHAVAGHHEQHSRHHGSGDRSGTPDHVRARAGCEHRSRRRRLLPFGPAHRETAHPRIRAGCRLAAQRMEEYLGGQFVTTILTVSGVLLLVSALLITWRVLAGPTSLDRLVAVDAILAIAMCGLTVWA